MTELSSLPESFDALAMFAREYANQLAKIDAN
jgi:hypothetical protein